ETQTDMALAGEVINFRRTHLGENAAERGPIGEIAVMEEEALAIDIFVAAQMLDARAEKIARSPNDSMNGIAFFQQQFGQIRAVLAGDTGYKRTLRILVHRSEIPQTQFNEAALSYKNERVSSSVAAVSDRRQRRPNTIRRSETAATALQFFPACTKSERLKPLNFSIAI